MNKEELINYMIWLEYLIDINNGYIDESIILYNKKDKNNLQKIMLFYKEVEAYFKDNYISPIKNNGNEYYQISYNNKGYLIGNIISLDNVIFCKKAESKKEEFTNFNDIINKKIQDNTKITRVYLAYLEREINLMYSKGIPLEVIEDVVNNKISSLKYENKVKKKELK